MTTNPPDDTPTTGPGPMIPNRVLAAALAVVSLVLIALSLTVLL